MSCSVSASGSAPDSGACSPVLVCDLVRSDSVISAIAAGQPSVAVYIRCTCVSVSSRPLRSTMISRVSCGVSRSSTAPISTNSSRTRNRLSGSPALSWVVITKRRW